MKYTKWRLNESTAHGTPRPEDEELSASELQVGATLHLALHDRQRRGGGRIAASCGRFEQLGLGDRHRGSSLVARRQRGGGRRVEPEGGAGGRGPGEDGLFASGG